MSRPFPLALALVTVTVLLSAIVPGAIYAIAHPDDDLLFQSPTLLDDVDSGECITSIFLTSGDSGAGSAYARSREVGNQAAYAQMFGVNSTWTEFYATFGGQPVLVRTLIAKPQHQAVFFRLPDGGWDTGGFAATGYQTLRGLYFGSIDSITNQPGDATYTLATLKQALSQILAARQPSRVRTLDYFSDFDGGDHDDHLATGRVINEVVGSGGVSGFMGYPVQNLAPTLSTSSTEFQRKIDAFFTYTPYDSAECQSFSDCSGRGEASWLQREYVVTSDLATTSSSGTPQTPAVLPSGTNIAPLAVASSSSNEGSSVAFAAIDGVISGYPRNDSAEWASDHEGAGAWLKLTWDPPVSINAVVLYDRPNSDDWLQAGTLSISDGSSMDFTNTVNDGSAFVIQLPQTYTTTSLLLTVTQVSSTTASVGISELLVYGISGATVSSTSTSSAPSSTATSSVSGNLALNATASASSWSVSTDQTPEKAIDGVANGYKADGTGDYTKEWVSDHELQGAYLELQWSSPVTANQIVLYDRPNIDDQVTSATITFSDGSTLAVGALNNAGSATTLSFATKTFSSLVFTVNSVSSTTSNVGLAEIQVFYTMSASTTSAASASSTSTPVSTSVTSSTPSVTSSAAPGQTSQTSSLDLALNATASASSWSASTDQTPDKAIDGVANGYKADGTGDYTKEWASDHELQGAYLELQWGSPVTANQIVLYDRPNADDQVTSAIITFSDGSTLAVGALNNAGSATTLTFAARTFSSLVFTVNSVSSTTSNVGLAEIQVFYTTAASTTGTALASSTSVVVSSSVTSSTASATSSSVTISTSSAAPPQTSGTSSLDLALDATASASTWTDTTSQTPDKAIDGVVNGYKESGTGDYTKEWATDQEGAVATFALTWTSVISANRVVLYDRPNLNDQITSAYIEFSDLSTVMIPALANNGSATTVDFGDKTFSSLVLYVTGASNTTSSVGLAEIQIYYIANATRVAATAASSSSNTDASVSDAAVSSTSTAVPSTSSSASASNSGVSAPTTTRSTITFSSAATSTTMNSAVSSSTSSSSSTTRSAAPTSTGLTNYARQAESISASSSGTAFGQTPDKAVDGVISGYPADYTAEWATNQQGAGAWLQLTWPSAVTINQVALFDRPNSDDWITDATLQFSDRSIVKTGALVNSGAGLYVNFTARSTTTLRFTIVRVSSTTSNAGLAEIQVFNNPRHQSFGNRSEEHFCHHERERDDGKLGINFKHERGIEIVYKYAYEC